MQIHMYARVRGHVFMGPGLQFRSVQGQPVISTSLLKNPFMTRHRKRISPSSRDRTLLCIIAQNVRRNPNWHRVLSPDSNTIEEKGRWFSRIFEIPCTTSVMPFIPVVALALSDILIHLKIKRYCKINSEWKVTGEKHSNSLCFVFPPSL